MDIFFILYAIFWLAVIVGSIIFLFVVVFQRLKEKKSEKEKHKDYDQY